MRMKGGKRVLGLEPHLAVLYRGSKGLEIGEAGWFSGVSRSNYMIGTLITIASTVPSINGLSCSLTSDLRTNV